MFAVFSTHSTMPRYEAPPRILCRRASERERTDVQVHTLIVLEMHLINSIGTKPLIAGHLPLFWHIHCQLFKFIQFMIKINCQFSVMFSVLSLSLIPFFPMSCSLTTICKHSISDSKCFTCIFHVKNHVILVLGLNFFLSSKLTMVWLWYVTKTLCPPKTTTSWLKKSWLLFLLPKLQFCKGVKAMTDIN